MPPVNPPDPLPLLIIPGVDPSAPPNAQIDQIDQQITFMLQDIDANFAKIHHVITERIIPALKRFDRDTQPVKEASKFWRSFFEAAAQIQVSQPDQSLLSGAPTYTDQETAEETISAPDQTQTGSSSFLGGAAVSSTPLPGTALSSQHITGASDLESRSRSRGRSPEEESWAASVESPFTKLDRQLRDDLKLDSGESQSQPGQRLGGYSSILSDGTDTPLQSPVHYAPPSTVGSSTAGDILPPADPTVRTGAAALQSTFPAEREKEKEKGKQRADRTNGANGALLKNVLKSNAAQRTPRAALNPFRPAGAGEEQGKRWNGIADLRLPSPAKPQQHQHRTPRRDKGMPPLNLPIDDDSDDDGLPPGMSPPVTMNFTLPAKKLARTPAKEVARLTVEGMTRGLRGDTPSPEADDRSTAYSWQAPTSAAHPTPPRRRPTASPAKKPSRMSTLHPRVSQIMQEGNISFPSSTTSSGDGGDSSFEDFGSPPTQHLNYPGSAGGTGSLASGGSRGGEGDESFDSEGDSFSSVGSAPPGVRAPMFGGGRDISVDDSFDSSEDGDDSFAPLANHRQPSAQEEETVFGVRKADGGFGRPSAFGPGVGQGQGRRQTTGAFELLGRGQDDMTVHGGRVEDAAVGESPTPWPRER